MVKVYFYLSLISCIFIMSIALNAMAEPDFIWAGQAGGDQLAGARGIAVDDYGNSYITGMFTGTVYFGDPGSANTIVLTSMGQFDAYTAKLCPNGNYLWARHAGSLQNVHGRGIEVDNSGNVIITGLFNDTLHFGRPEDHDYFQLASRGDEDIFIAKLDNAGNYLWVSQAGGPEWDRGYTVTSDSFGNSYITGIFSGTAYFGPNDRDNNIALISNGGSDIFLAKLDPDGDFIWARSAGGTGDEYSIGIAIDNDDNLFITGFFVYSAYFGGPCIENEVELISMGDRDIFIAKYDSDGNFLWARSAGGPANDLGWGIATDLAGNCYISGFFLNMAYFGKPGEDDTILLISEGEHDLFLTKLCPGGNFLWARQASSTKDIISYGNVVDSEGNSYLTGYFEGEARFGTHQGHNAINIISRGNKDIFIAKTDTDGNFLYARHAGGTGDIYSFGIALDQHKHPYIAGYFNGTIYCGLPKDPYTIELTAGGNYDILTAKAGSQHKGSAIIGLLKPDMEGIWQWKYTGNKDDKTEWTSLLPELAPKKMMSGDISGNGLPELICLFMENGLYYYCIMTNTWDLLTDSVILDFTLAKTCANKKSPLHIILSLNNGLFILEHNKNKQSIINVPADIITASNINQNSLDELIVTFKDIPGFYYYDFAIEKFSRIIIASPSQIICNDITGDGRNEIIAAFDGLGIYLFRNIDNRDMTIIKNPPLDLDIPVMSGWHKFKEWEVQRLTWGTPDENTYISCGNIRYQAGNNIIVTYENKTFFYSYCLNKWQNLHNIPSAKVISGRFTGNYLEDLIISEKINKNILLYRSLEARTEVILESGNASAMLSF